MDVTVAESGPCRRTINITLPADRVKAHLDKVFKDAAGQVEIKGFRKGKVPRKILEQKFGDEIRSEAKESLINSSFEEAVREQKLNPIGRPDIEGIDEAPLDEAPGPYLDALHVVAQRGSDDLPMADIVHELKDTPEGVRAATSTSTGSPSAARVWGTKP